MQNSFPDILAVVQVALEGAISRGRAQTALAAGQLPQGDLLPWIVGQQFQDSRFPGLSGARIVRIATHPSILGAGYGSKATTLLRAYYEGEFAGVPLSPPVFQHLLSARFAQQQASFCSRHAPRMQRH